jgi:hypothetical protein
VGGSVIQDVSEETLVATMSDRGQPAEGAIIPCIGGHLPRTLRQGPGKAVRVQTRRRLFFPPPRPRVGSWHRAHRPGGLATGASWPAGRASRPQPPAAPLDRSRDGCRDCPVGPDRTGPHGRMCDTWCSHAAQRCSREHADPTGRDGPSRAASAGTAGLYRPQDHNADTRSVCHGGCREPSLAGAGRQWRSSLRWDRVDTHPHRPWLCPPGAPVGASTRRYMPLGNHTKTRQRCYSLGIYRHFFPDATQKDIVQ